jgi:hypothetical protein
MTITSKLLILTLIIGGSAQAQSPTEWSQQHPEVLLIESQDASSELLARLDQSAALYIVYSDELLLEDIENFNESRLVKGISELLDPTLDESEFIKSWVTQNSSIKIVRRSYYDSLDAERRTAYNSKKIMILEGEIITFSDIKKFETKRSEAPETGADNH